MLLKTMEHFWAFLPTEKTEKKGVSNKFKSYLR